MGFLDDAMAWLHDTLVDEDVAGVLVTVRRGDAETADVPAEIGRTEAELERDDGTFVTVESRDFLIAAADYLVDGAAVEPRAGDRIVETVGTKSLVYEVAPIADEPAWRYTDPERSALRIHTKLIAALYDGQFVTDEADWLVGDEGEPLLAGE